MASQRGAGRRAGTSANSGAPPPNLLLAEQEMWERGFTRVAGVDEVGRGPLAGPVVAAAVIFAPGAVVEGACDSKRLTAARRERLIEPIYAAALAVAVGAASAREIDRLNIRRATALAMQRALARLRISPEHVLVDGLAVPELGLEAQTAIVGGDATVHAIACASVVAKVTRDRLMQRLARRYPGFGWERNMGYGTREHLDALHRLGPCAHHRRSFRPIANLAMVAASSRPHH